MSGEKLMDICPPAIAQLFNRTLFQFALISLRGCACSRERIFERTVPFGWRRCPPKSAVQYVQQENRMYECRKTVQTSRTYDTHRCRC
jgi:hypothetical protein